MTKITFTIPAVPVAQPRQRTRVVQKGGKTFPQNYQPQTVGTGADRRPHPVVEFKHAVRKAASEAHAGSPLTGPLRVDLVMVFPRPAGMFWKTKPMPRVPHVKTPDRDNVDKAILDAMKSIIFVDDAQVCDGRIQKFVAAGHEQPHVEVSICEVSS